MPLFRLSRKQPLLTALSRVIPMAWADKLRRLGYSKPETLQRRIMTNTRTRPDHSGLSSRKRQAIFRATHRGTREMDLLLGSFVDYQIHTFSNSEMDDLEILMEAPDWDIYKWVSGTLPVPDIYNTPLFQRWVTYQAEKSKEQHIL